MTKRAPTGGSWPLLALVGVLALSFNLRPVATALGPVLQEMRHDLGLGPDLAGVLTALPGLVFGVVAGVAVTLARRFGLLGALLGAIVTLALGLLARAFAVGPISLLALSALALAGAAVGNVLVPAFIKGHFPQRQARAMSAYAATLGLGAMAAALLAAPMATSVPGGWRSALGLWGLVALGSLPPWIALWVRERRVHGGPAPRPESGRIAVQRSRQAVALAVFFGVQSMQAYVQFGWAAQMFRDAGISPTQAGILVALIAAFGVPSGLLMPLVVARLKDLRPIMVLLGALLTAGYLGILWAPTKAPWLWATCLGLSGFAFPAALALITGRTRAPAVTAAVSGFTQSLGYLLAALGPFVVGALLALTGGWALPLGLLAACGPVLAVAGILAARPSVIDDALAR